MTMKGGNPTVGDERDLCQRHRATNPGRTNSTPGCGDAVVFSFF